VRASFTLEEVRRVVDILALYKLNALHLHLTDDQGWRLPVGRSAQRT
jgi:hexosaminidase